MSLFLYRIFVVIFLPLALLRLIYRSLFNKALLCHWQERFACYNNKAARSWQNKKVIWIHAVSVGETNAVKPLVDTIIKENDGVYVLVTHGTMTGRHTFLNDSQRVIRKFLPYDTPWAMKKFLNTFSPKVGMVVETEIWPSLFIESKKRKLPLFLINGRLSNKSLKKYLLVKSFTQQVLDCLEGLYVQTEENKNNFLQLTNQPIQVIGNTKFDFPIPADLPQNTLSLKTTYGLTNKFIMLAASTRDGEEEKILQFYKNLKLANTVLILVPRHPQRFDQVASLIKKFNFSYARKSLNKDKVRNPAVILGDTMGEMHTYYNLAHFIILGGSINNYGSQNPIEGLSLNKPLAIGRSIFNFKSVIEEGTKAGIFYRFSKLDDLTPIIKEFHAKPNDDKKIKQLRKRFLEKHRGATKILIQLANRYL